MSDETEDPEVREDGPRLETLTNEECLQLLKTEQVGRLAVVVDRYPQVFPVNYRMDDFVVVFRTRLGTRLAGAHHQNVGFEVDHIDPVTHTGWSVLVQGMAEDISARPPDRVTDRTQNLGVESWVGDRHWLLRIFPAHITGRRIVPGDMGWAEDDRGYL